MLRCLLFIAALIMTFSCVDVDKIDTAPNPDNLIVAAYVWPS